MKVTANDPKACSLVVFLNGEQQFAAVEAVEADDDRGYVDRHVVNEKGQAQLDPLRPGFLQIERIFGTVLISELPCPGS